MKRLNETLSIDFDLYLLITSPLRLCSLHDLQTKYNTADAYDLLEVLDANREIQEIAEQRAKQQENMNG
jgi:hypothetical protein